MAGTQYGAYNQRSARFRRRPSPQEEGLDAQGYGSDFKDSMALKGRSQSATGQYKTRPGAPLSVRDSAPTGLPGVPGPDGFTPDAVWNSFFPRKNGSSGKSPLVTDATGVGGGTVSMPPTGAPPASGMQPSWSGDSAWQPSLAGEPSSLDPSYFATVPDATVTPDASNPNSYLSATMRSQDGYFNKIGAPIARPQINPGSMTVPPLPKMSSIAPSDNIDWGSLGSGSTASVPDMSMNWDQEL